MDKNADRHLVIKALLMAVGARQPAQPVLVHSDQGSQYGSSDYLAFMKANNLEPSMSRRGNCHDNAVQKVFWPHLKNMSRREKSTQHVKMQNKRYSILLKCFTIQ